MTTHQTRRTKQGEVRRSSFMLPKRLLAGMAVSAAIVGALHFGSGEASAYSTRSTFYCPQFAGAFFITLPWETERMAHKYYYQVDGRGPGGVGTWYQTPWYYTYGLLSPSVFNESALPPRWENIGYDASGLPFYRFADHTEIGGGRWIQVWEQQYFYDSGRSVSPFSLGPACMTTGLSMPLVTTYAPADPSLYTWQYNW